MPPSQLKRLKASLREQGLVGPQQSKKQKKRSVENGFNKDKRVHRTEALNSIRDQFNPFEYKWSKGPKFPVTTIANVGGSKGGIVGRPYVKKSQAEEQLQKGVILDRRNRNKVGGIQDRRFGENDPTMDPEIKMLQRSTELAQRRNRHSAFDLEDDEPGELTHLGQSLSLDGPNIKDDFEEDDLSDEEDHVSDTDRRSRKRRRGSDEEFEGEDQGESDEDIPQRKKSKNEVMKEVVAKSKLYKYERQAAKDEDEDLREELDKDFRDIHSLLREMGSKSKSTPKPLVAIPAMNPDRAALLAGTDKVKFDKDYDVELKRMAMEARSIPSERTKTEEELAEYNAEKLRKAQRRLEGRPENSDEEDAANDSPVEDDADDDFGFGLGMQPKLRTELGVEDEDDFLIDDEFLSNGSIDFSDDGSPEDQLSEDDEELESHSNLEREASPDFFTGANVMPLGGGMPENSRPKADSLVITKCPESHEELLETTTNIAIPDIPTFIQQVRLQFDPKLNSENKEKLGHFAVSLVDHISYLANQSNRPPFSILETIIRHIHSLARTNYSLEIGHAFRRHLKSIHESRPLDLTPGDLVLLTGIGTIFPSDGYQGHFHEVVVPAVLTMGRYLGLKIPQTLSDYALGAYLCTLCLHYQRRAKRYLPEVMNFIANTLCVLAPTKLSKRPGNFPYHEPKTSVRIARLSDSTKNLAFYDCFEQNLSSTQEISLKSAVLETNLKLVEVAADIWNGLPAFFEVFEPILRITQHLEKPRALLQISTRTLISKLSGKLNVQLKLAQLSRRPLELHHHRPLAIKMAIPKFEENFQPGKHYDSNKERSEASKLRKEYKREKKGAIRELRKEGKVIARENLREKKEKDAAYEKKYKRLVAEIQGEEGKEAKAYEREKEWRKKGKK